MNIYLNNNSEFFTAGIGSQSLFPLIEGEMPIKGDWIDALGHYYLPLANFTYGFAF